MKKFTFLILAIVFTMGALPGAFALNNWTILMYMCSDDTKHDYMVNSHVKTINGLAQLPYQPNDCSVVALFDHPRDGGFRYLFQDGKAVVDAKLGPINMGSPKTLWDFLKFGTTKYPAKNYALVIAGHGSGIFSWRGTGGVNDVQPGKVIFDPDHFVGYDDSASDCLTVMEVQAVLDAFKEKLNAGRPIGLVIFDACMPGSVEMLCQLSQSVEVVGGSPESVLIGGMPYPSVIKQLIATSAITPDQLGELFAKSYVSNTSMMGRDGELFSIYRPGQIAKLIGAFDVFTVELLNAWNSGKKIEVPNQFAYEPEDSRYWELSRLLLPFVQGDVDLKSFRNAGEIKQAAQDALDSIKLAKVKVYATGKFAENKVDGLSIAWPKKEEYLKWHAFYKALAFSKMTHWDDFLDAFYGPEKSGFANFLHKFFH
ncbi:MAG: hypothetical protein HQM08_27190 [Candidatus Riflebacteria bacterium]|nr:hypothetical protein [Candidatus Riflebacteria bacterium]